MEHGVSKTSKMVNTTKTMGLDGIGKKTLIDYR